MTVEVVDDPIVISWSEISAFRQCPFKHHLAYRERWQTDEDKEVLARGTHWHEILEAHYNGQIELRDWLLGRTVPVPTERQELLEWMFQGYLAQWAEADEDWEVQAAEFKGFAPLPNPDGGVSRFMLKVKIDLLAVQRGRLWLWDHKTGRNLPKDKELDLDDQFGLYQWCMREIGYPVFGCVYNAARTHRNVKGHQPLDQRFSRILMRRTDPELDMIAAEAYRTADRMWPEGGITSIPERTPDTNTCRWMCDFTEACLSSRKGGKLDDMLVAHGYGRRPFREVEIEWKQHRDSTAG